MPAGVGTTGRLGPGSRAFLRGSKEPVLIVRALANKSWEVERLDKRDGSRTGELMNKTSYQLKKIQRGDSFPGEYRVQQTVARTTATTAPTSTATTTTAASNQQQRQEQQQEGSSNEEEALVVVNSFASSGAANNEGPQQEGGENQTGIEVLVARQGGSQQQQRNENHNQQHQRTQQQEHIAMTAENTRDDDEGFEVVALSNREQAQDEDEQNNNNNNGQDSAMAGPSAEQREHTTHTNNTSSNTRSEPTQVMDGDAGGDGQRGGDTVPVVRTREDAHNVVETILNDDDDRSWISDVGIAGPPAVEQQEREVARNDQNLSGRTFQHTTDEDNASAVSLDDYFNDLEDYLFLFSDDEDAIDPNSLALAHEIESREEHRNRYTNYINRKKQLIEENWTVTLEPPSENGIDIGDRVRENKRNNPRFGIVVEKHPDSIPGTPLWNVLFDGDEEETLALTGRNDLRKIYDNRSFTWQIVDGDTVPDNLVEEFESVGVVGFDFRQSFAHSNLSTTNQRYDFPFLRLLIHMWPGKSLIVKFPVGVTVKRVSVLMACLSYRELARAAA